MTSRRQFAADRFLAHRFAGSRRRRRCRRRPCSIETAPAYFWAVGTIFMNRLVHWTLTHTLSTHFYQYFHIYWPFMSNNADFKSKQNQSADCGVSYRQMG